MRAFVLLEFIFGIVILGIVAITCSKLLLHLKQQEVFARQQSVLDLYNTLLQIDALIPSELVFKDNVLLWDKHQIFLKDRQLYLDYVLLLDDIDVFEVIPIGTDWLIRLCKKRTCLQKIKLVYGDKI